MKKPLLFFQKANKTNFLVIDENDTLDCDGCKKKINFGEPLIIHHSYSILQGFKKEHYCGKCKTKIPTRDQNEIRTGFLCSVIPENSVLVKDEPATLSFRKSLSVFEAAYLESETTTDKTIHAGRGSIEGASIGDKSYISHDASKNRNLLPDEFLKELGDMQNAQPYIEHKERKEIEAK